MCTTLFFTWAHFTKSDIWCPSECGWLTAEHLQKSGQGKLILMIMNHDVKNPDSKFVSDYYLLLHKSFFWTYFQLSVHRNKLKSQSPHLWFVWRTFVWWRLCRTALACEVCVWQVDPKGKNILSQVICSWEHEKILHFKSQKSPPLLIITQHQWAFSSPNQIWGNPPPSLKVFSRWRTSRKGILSPQWDYKNASWGMSHSRQHVTILKIQNPGGVNSSEESGICGQNPPWRRCHGCE